MNTKERAIEEKICPLEFAVNAISGKWKIPIVWQINEGKNVPANLSKELVKWIDEFLISSLKKWSQQVF